MRGERGARCLELLRAHHPEVKVVVVSPQRHTTTSAGHSPAARGRTSSRASTRLISPQRCHARTTKPCIRRSVSSPGRSTSCAGRTSKRARPRRAPAARWGHPRSARAHDERPYIALSVAGAMLCRCRMEEFEQRAGRGRCAQCRGMKLHAEGPVRVWIYGPGTGLGAFGRTQRGQAVFRRWASEPGLFGGRPCD